MGGGYLTEALRFVLDTFLGLFVLAVLLRFWFQLLRADFYNPVSRFLVTITSPVLAPLRRFIPGLWGIDLAAVVLLVALASLRVFLRLLLLGVTGKPAGIVLLGIAELLSLSVWIFLIAIFIRVILSWVAPQTYNPTSALVVGLTEPVLRPARRWTPALPGLDLAPLFAAVGLYLLILLVVRPLTDLALWLIR